MKKWAVAFAVDEHRGVELHGRTIQLQPNAAKMRAYAYAEIDRGQKERSTSVFAIRRKSNGSMSF
jgi:hypothetical protein